MTETNQLLLTGPLAGEITPPGYFLSRFDRLSPQLQAEIGSWADGQIPETYVHVGDDEWAYAYSGAPNTPLDIDQVMHDFEDSWECQATDDEPTMWEPW